MFDVDNGNLRTNCVIWCSHLIPLAASFLVSKYPCGYQESLIVHLTITLPLIISIPQANLISPFSTFPNFTVTVLFNGRSCFIFFDETSRRFAHVASVVRVTFKVTSEP